MSIFRIILFRLTLLLGLLPLVAHANDAVRVCGDRDPISMMIAPQSDQSTNKKPKLVGFSVEMVRLIFSSMGKEVQFSDDLPWKRCLNEVESGTIDFAMDAYFDLDRAKLFAFSTHYNTLTPQIFFLKSNPVDFSELSKLKKYRGCGILGTSYDHYGLQGKDFDLGADRSTLIKKLYAKRCDYFLEELEDMASYKTIGIDYLADPGVQHETVNWAVAPSKFLITAKNGKNAPMLDQINSAIYSLIKTGQAEKLWKKMGIGLPYKP